MKSADIIKLAPTLSAKEKYKLVVTDFHRELVEGRPTLSGAEREAIVRCEKRDVWEEYTRHIGIMQWASTFWSKDIETEKLRVFACSLMLERALDRLMDAANESLEIDDSLYDNLRTNVELLEKNAMEFYSFPAAIAKVEQEYLYGTPLFDEKRKMVIAGYYEWGDEMFERYNGRIGMICVAAKEKGRLKPLADGYKHYFANKPQTEKAIVDRLIDDVMSTVDAEMDMLGR